jgi:hypothetical protein
MTCVSSGARGQALADAVASGSVSVAECGARIEMNESAAELMVFARRLEAIRFHADHAARCFALGCLEAFALRTATARCERLAGRIDAAMLAEADAERAYKRLPEGDRW